MKRITHVTVWGEKLSAYDFYTSGTVEITAKDIEADLFEAQKLVEPRYILDLGANVGLWSMGVARKFPKAKIFAVDAAPHTCDNLCANLSENKITNVQVVQCAVGGEKKKATFHQHPLNSGGFSIRNPADFPAFEIETELLDALFDQLDVPYFDFVKIDIEGSEYETLQAFTQWEKIRRLGIELHGYQDERPETESEMEALYRLCVEKLGAENVCAVSYRRSYIYGKEIPWGVVQAREEDEARQKTVLS